MTSTHILSHVFACVSRVELRCTMPPSGCANMSVCIWVCVWVCAIRLTVLAAGPCLLSSMPTGFNLFGEMIRRYVCWTWFWSVRLVYLSNEYSVKCCAWFIKEFIKEMPSGSAGVCFLFSHLSHFNCPSSANRNDQQSRWTSESRRWGWLNVKPGVHTAVMSCFFFFFFTPTLTFCLVTLFLNYSAKNKPTKMAQSWEDDKKKKGKTSVGIPSEENSDTLLPLSLSGSPNSSFSPHPSVFPLFVSPSSHTWPPFLSIYQLFFSSGCLWIINARHAMICVDVSCVQNDYSCSLRSLDLPLLPHTRCRRPTLNTVCHQIVPMWLHIMETGRKL